jgi:hypothetical protein
MAISSAIALLIAVIGVTAIVRNDDRTAPRRKPGTAAAKANRPPITSAPPAEPSPIPSESTSSPSASPCGPGGPGWDCDQQRRFTAATAFLTGKQGKLGVIVRDRTTGAEWRAGTTDNVTWTGSTIKLAIAAALLERSRAKEITLTSADRSNMHTALVDSNNDSATALWNRFGGQPMFDRFRTVYGMTKLSVVSGYDLFWRNLQCNADDLYHLMIYVLEKLNPEDRTYLVTELRGVSSNQHWGVWGAGSTLRPGNKDGWAQKLDSGANRWITHTVGFAGPDEKYVVVATYSLPPSGTLSDGAHAVSDLVATIFGSPIPAPITSP